MSSPDSMASQSEKCPECGNVTRVPDQAQKAESEVSKGQSKGRKRCPKCKEWLDKSATKCPHCQSKQPDPAWAVVLAIIIVIGIVIGLGVWGFRSCSSVFTPSPETKAERQQKEWYDGGTLHRSTLREWKAATFQNKLATAGDFVANANNVLGKRQVGAELKAAAEDLVIAIDIMAGSDSLNLDKERTSDIAAMILTVKEGAGSK